MDLLRGCSSQATPQQSPTPMLLLAGSKDNLLSAAFVHKTAAAHHADIHIFPDHGHNLIRSQHWPVLADIMLDWLKQQAL